MKSIRRTITRSLSTLRRRPFSIPPPGPLLPQDELVDEEICPGYNFEEVLPSEARRGTCQSLSNSCQGWLGYLVHESRDQCEFESVVALKITNATSRALEDELEIEERIAKTDPSHRGRALFRTLSESFEVFGPEGTHMCLAYEPMREPLWFFQRRFKDGMIPIQLVKTYVLFLLTGLDYLHSACRIVHTDLKPENIMVTFEDPAVLSDFMNCQVQKSMQHKIDSTGRPVYCSHNDFGPLVKMRNIPKIVDLGLASILDCEDDWGVHRIQPGHYRAPEIILGCGWRMSADIWNLGTLLWDIIQGKELFHQVYDTEGRYDAKAHLADMIALLEPPPQEVLARYHSMQEFQWPEPIMRQDGKVCETAEQYFDGTFFDKDGKFLHDDLIPNRKLADALPPSLGEKDTDKFLSFVKGMLVWNPEERKKASELLRHPFLRLK